MEKKICPHKNCIHKGKRQPVGNFSKNKGSKDGFACNCKDCVRAARQRPERRKRVLEISRKLKFKAAKHEYAVSAQGRKVTRARERKYLRTQQGKRRRLLYGAYDRAKTEGIPFALTLNDIPEIPKCCPLLGIPLFRGKGGICNNSPSLDRIENARGYVPGNIWIISYRANAMKSNFTIAQLREFADLIERAVATIQQTN